MMRPVALAIALINCRTPSPDSQKSVPPLYSLAKLITELIERIQNTAFCQKTGIQS